MIPSVSGSQAHAADVLHAAHWVESFLRRLTPDVRVVATRHGPVTVARLRSPSRGRGPMLVVYGHLDVKPPGPGWTSQPFRPVLAGRRLVARGASDDKGQLMGHLLALRAWHASGGLPGDVVVVVDGAEEVGSPGLAEALDRSRHQVGGRPVAILVSDTRAAGPGVPSLTVMQRGSLSLRVIVDSGGPAVHAGRLGGAVLDPALVLSARLGPLSSTVHALSARCPVSTSPRPGHDVAAAALGRAVYPDHLVERTTTRGSVAVISWRCVGGPGAVGARAEAVLDVRVPPGVSLVTAHERVRRALTAGIRPPLRVEVRRIAATPGLCARLPPALLDAVRGACLDGYGVPPRVDASGGTIPALAVLDSVFHAPPLLLGTGPVDDGAHGPDEYLQLDDWASGILMSVSLMRSLLGGQQARWPGCVIAPAHANRLTRREHSCHGPSGLRRSASPRTPPALRT
jgi:acetylornithine deacetylase/succinyl-diaminopimelate desuccinylase-like protein